MSYVELLSKSNFSFLTGASNPEEIVHAAHSQGLLGVALNDRNGVYGIAKAYKETKELSNFKYMVGAEFSFFDHPEVTLIAQNLKGYSKITQLLTRTHADKEKGKGNLHFAEFTNYLSEKDASGLVCILRSQEKLQLSSLKDLFQKQCYLALIRYLDGQDKKRSEFTDQLAHQYGLDIVASNDVYYHEKNRKIIQDVLISIREGKPLNEVGAALFSNGERYFKTHAQMQKLYEDRPEALIRTVQIAESCPFSLSELKYIYPSEWIPQGHTAQSYLESLVEQRIPIIYKKGIPERLRAQLNHELGLIQQLNYADYFLTIYDIVDFARSINILCQGRGSAANSVVCYVLGITAIDPIEMNLLFERFLSVERNEPPDIDVDFEHERREEVIQYIYKKYGRDRAAMVSAVITYRRRSAFREVAKAFGVPVGTLSAKKVELDFEQLTKDMPQVDRLREKINYVTETIKGFPRHISIHSGGFTLSAKPIIDIVPVEPARMVDRTIVQWDKYDLDILGLLKIDVLSLGMLSALRKTLALVGKELHEIPHGDKETYAMIQRRETVGTFQIESRAQMQMLGRLQPENFYELVIEVAIVRPGPIIGNMVHPYLKRKRGLEKITFPNDKVKNILGRTLGVPLFQEQVMKMAMDLAGFTPGESDRLRRSINAWRSSDSMDEMGNRLRRGLINNGLTEEFADQIFKQIQGFSEYGFPESHAASFALLAYASCYLKHYHPAEFACSLVNSQPMGFYRNDTILYEAMRNGVKVLPVCIHKSVWDCTIEAPKTIRLGFCVVSGLAQKDVDVLLAERAQKPFANMPDFLKRTPLRKDVLSRLAMAGRFEDFKFDAREALWALLEYNTVLSEKDPQQMNLFHQDVWQEPTQEKHFAALGGFEKIQYDYEGFYLSTQGHPMQELRRTHKKLPKTTSRDLQKMQTGTHVRTSGLTLIRQKPPTAKGVVFATLEDEFGFIDVVLHPKVFEEYKEVFLQNCFILVEGRLQRDKNTVSLTAKHVEAVLTGLTLEPDQYFY